MTTHKVCGILILFHNKLRIPSLFRIIFTHDRFLAAYCILSIDVSCWRDVLVIQWLLADLVCVGIFQINVIFLVVDVTHVFF